MGVGGVVGREDMYTCLRMGKGGGGGGRGGQDLYTSLRMIIINTYFSKYLTHSPKKMGWGEGEGRGDCTPVSADT